MLGSLAKFSLEIARDSGLSALVVVAVVIVVVVGRKILRGGGGMCDCTPDKLGFVDALR